MKIKCINAKGSEGKLTEGGIYEVKDPNTWYENYEIENPALPHGYHDVWAKNRFVALDAEAANADTIPAPKPLNPNAPLLRLTLVDRAADREEQERQLAFFKRSSEPNTCSKCGAPKVCQWHPEA